MPHFLAHFDVAGLPAVVRGIPFVAGLLRVPLGDRPPNDGLNRKNASGSVTPSGTESTDRFDGRAA